MTTKLKNRWRIRLIQGSCWSLLVACNGRLAVTKGAPGDASGGSAAAGGGATQNEVGGSSAGETENAGGPSGGTGENAGASGTAGNGGATAGNGGVGGTEAAGDCQDGIRNNAETDIDCGGPACPACAVGSTCGRHEDCDSSVCRAGTCQAPSCSDGKQNGDEGGVDCGGSCANQYSRDGHCAVQVSACSCGSSDGLSAVACGVNGGGGLSPTYLDASGSAAALSLCDSSNCDAYYWTLTYGPKLIVRTAGVAGLSQDGGTALVWLNQAPHSHPGSLPFLWHPDGSRTELQLGYVTSLSDDGSVAVGYDGSAFGRWTQGTGLVTTNLGIDFSGGIVMTADGSTGTVQLSSSSTDSGLVRWTASGLGQSLGAPPQGATSATATAISRDGAVVVGEAQNDSGERQSFRWSAASGIVSLAPVATGVLDHGIRLNADGSVLFGTQKPSAGNAPASAFRWTQATGVSDLANAPAAGSVIQDTSADGSIAVGFTLEGQSNPAFVWDATNGMVPMRGVLEQAGIDLAGWQIGPPLAISHDGHVVFGEGTCGGVPAIFRAVLPP